MELLRASDHLTCMCELLYHSSCRGGAKVYLSSVLCDLCHVASDVSIMTGVRHNIPAFLCLYQINLLERQLL